MKTNKSVLLLNAAAVAAVVASSVGGCASPDMRITEYRYNVYNNGGYFFGEGRLELHESPEGASVRIVSGTPGVSQCVSVLHPAKVTRDETYTTIVSQPAFANCDEEKYQIRNDGSGGVRYGFANGDWVKDQFNRGLTPKK